VWQYLLGARAEAVALAIKEEEERIHAEGTALQEHKVLFLFLLI
jgi:hypothetical protein